ncbi:hypothetical protein [Aliiroseovarius sediminis]|uniref:hypothetical protein n=1 Tax=Aliiroseovarius sediminis TaxID=2925839 RepID=UPI001F56DBD0|nr:hypothetical protein [Aliiroseovarius sediminis]MCI2393515.1 hypothetical protein [Aliiroseovarius sediminis]
MGLESTIEKLDKYFDRLEQGKAQKIEPEHVDEVIRKLEARAQQLEAELADTHKDAKKERVWQKIELVHKQKDRALWLKEKLCEAP